MDVIGDRPWVLDGLAIHIDDVKRAVGCVDQIDRAKPHIGRCDKLHIEIGGDDLKRHAVRRDELAMDEIIGDFACKNLTAIFRGIGGPAINRDACRRGKNPARHELAARSAVVLRHPAARPKIAPGFPGTDPQDRQRIAGFTHVVNGIGHLEVGISPRQRAVEDDVLRGIANIAEEAVAPIIEPVAKAGTPGDRFDFSRARIDPQIVAQKF